MSGLARAQSLSLVANHGFDRAKHIVDFSHTAAGETKYRPDTFGGILQYASRAVADFDCAERLEKIAAQVEVRMAYGQSG
jgi:hypothetical protein